MRYNFDDLSRLPIQDAHLYWCALNGHATATNALRSIADCPYGTSRETRIRCYRLAWRTAFRRARIRHLLAAADTFEHATEGRAWKAAA